jgi:DNA-sulfur modification-associated
MPPINRRPAAEAEPLFTLNDVIPVKRDGRINKFTASITIGRVAELLQSDQIHVDYDYQRGVKVTYRKDGTEQRRAMVDRSRVDEIASKILANKLHGGSLVWNLRPSEVAHEYDPRERRLHILEGRPSIPDSNHRHQAAVKVAQLVQARGMSFDLDSYEFPLTIEVLDLEGEKNLFHEYNQLGRPANPTRSNYLNSANIHNSLVSRLIEDPSFVLHNHVELVTNTVSSNSTKITTFNVLATAVKEAFRDLDDSNSAEIEAYLHDFLNHLARVRREVGYLPLSSRQAIRAQSIGDSGLAIYAYIALAGEIRTRDDWQLYVNRLGEVYRHFDQAVGEVVFDGDLMSRDNPLWHNNIVIRNPSGKLGIVNRLSSRSFLVQALRQIVGLAQPARDESDAA